MIFLINGVMLFVFLKSQIQMSLPYPSLMILKNDF